MEGALGKCRGCPGTAQGGQTALWLPKEEGLGLGAIPEAPSMSRFRSSLERGTMFGQAAREEAGVCYICCSNIMK